MIFTWACGVKHQRGFMVGGWLVFDWVWCSTDELIVDLSKQDFRGTFLDALYIILTFLEILFVQLQGFK